METITLSSATVRRGLTPTEFRPLVIRMGLKTEARGMKLTRGKTCLSIVKSEYGLKARTAAEMLPKFDALLTEMGYTDLT